MKRFEFIEEESEQNSKSSATLSGSLKSKSNKSKIFSVRDNTHDDDDDLEGIHSIMSGLNK